MGLSDIYLPLQNVHVSLQEASTSPFSWVAETQVARVETSSPYVHETFVIID